MRSVLRALTAVVFLGAANAAAVAQTLPSPWTSSDVGSPQVTGGATTSFTIYGGGTDIADSADQFRFVYQAVTGDTEVIARVYSLANTHSGAKSGVMFRDGLTGDAMHAFAFVTPGEGYGFQRRPTRGATSVNTAGGTGAAPGWVRVVRRGDVFEGFRSADGQNWTRIASETIPMGDTVYVGLAVTSRNTTTGATAVLDNVTVRAVAANQSPAATITAPANGAQVAQGSTVSITATATDPENRVASVEFYVESTLVATDTTAPYAASWTAAGPGTYAIRAAVYDADGGSSWSSPVSVTVPAPNGAPSVTLTSPTAGATFTAPATINLAANATDPESQLARVEFFNGTTLLGSDTSAPYTFAWSNVAAGTYSLTAVAYDTAGLNTRSAAVSVTVGGTSGGGGLPSGQTAADVGSPAVAGSTSFASGTYTVRAGGRDIWDAADQFHFVYQQITGDMNVVARVTSLGNTDPWAKAGVMIRETLAAGSRNALMSVTPGNGAWFGYRLQANGASAGASSAAGTTSAWLRLVRTGNLIEGYWSTDGATWTRVGAQTIQMGAAVYVGLATSSHNTSTATTATFTNFTVTGGTANQAPTAAITSPASGATFTAPASIAIAASAADSDGTVARVEFFQGSTLLGTDTSAPYAFTWSSVAAGSYALRAVAYDNTGASTSSATVNVTVQGAANQPPSVTLTSPANGASFTAPATISVTANASDPENQLTRVEFFSGSTLLGTDTSAPYAFTWSNVAAGTYAIRAVAYDNAGANASSATATVTVTTVTSPAPTTVVFAASSDHATNVTSYLLSVFAQGADPATATPVATSDLGKPAPAGNNDITVDRASFFTGLAPGNYVATVSAIGPGGQTRSASVTFTR